MTNWVLLFNQPAVSRDWNGKRFAQQVFRVYSPVSREAIMSKAAGAAISMVNGQGQDLPIGPTDKWDGMAIDKVTVVGNSVFKDVVVEYSNELQRIQYAGSFQSENVSVPVGVMRYIAMPGAANGATVPTFELQDFQTKMGNGRHRVIVFINTYTMPSGPATLADVLRPIRLDTGRLHILRGTKAMPDKFNLALTGNADYRGGLPLGVSDFWRFEGADWEVLGQFDILTSSTSTQAHFWLRIAYSWIHEGGVYADSDSRVWPGLAVADGFAAPPAFGSQLARSVPGFENSTRQEGGMWAIPPFERIIAKKADPSNPAAQTAVENIPRPTFKSYLQVPKVNARGVLLLPGLS